MQHIWCLLLCVSCLVRDMGWLRLVGSTKLYVSFAKEPCKRDDILQKRPTIWSILLTAATRERSATHRITLPFPVSHCARLHHAATRCNTLQHAASLCNTLRHTEPHCNILQHSATYCNTLQHTATRTCATAPLSLCTHLSVLEYIFVGMCVFIYKCVYIERGEERKREGV